MQTVIALASPALMQLPTTTLHAPALSARMLQRVSVGGKQHRVAFEKQQ